MGRIALFFVCIFFSSCGLFLQKTGMKNYRLKDKIDSEGFNKYQYDFLYMSKLLDTSFPQLDSFFPQGDRDIQRRMAIKHLGRKNTMPKDFLLTAQKYIGSVHNQHTEIYLKSKFEYFYPFKVFNSYGDLYLRNIERTQDSLLIGKKIVSMNGLKVSEIQKRLKKFTFAENEIGQLADIRWKWYYYNVDYLQEIDVVHSRNDVLKIKFEDGSLVELNVVKGKEWDLYHVKELPHPLTQHRKKIYSYHNFPSANFGYMQYLACHDRDDILEGIESYIKPWLQPFAKAYAKRQFRKKNPSKRIAPYYNSTDPVFKEFVWEMVDSLNRSGVEHLIVDLRRNGGGNLYLGIQLLYFLTDMKDLKRFKDYAYTSGIYKKYFPGDYQKILINNPQVADNQLVLRSSGQDLFAKVKDATSNYYIPPNRPVFKGKIYVLANYQTGSAAAMLATLFMDNKLATLIGTSVGNNPTGPTTFTPLRLPKTKAYFGVASTYQIRPDTTQGKLLIPNYWVEYTIEDLAKGRDPFLQKAMELIKESSYQDK